ncbi:cache domain-containing protein [Palleronia pelagia]|nr:cache domain-containing protein [Palleronia pelagia]
MALVCSALVVFSAWIYQSRADSTIDAELDGAVRVRTQAAGAALARTIYSDWRDLTFLASQFSGARDRRQGMLEGLRGDGGRISWIGYARPDGIVAQATGSLLVGESVAERPWFRNGLRGQFASDVHDAVLLARLLSPGTGEVPRFVDLALPVRDDTGTVTGTLGMHIDADWVENEIEELAQSLGLELYLVGAQGDVVLSSADTVPDPQSLEILRTARTGNTTALRETWSDGETYFASLVPRVGYADLPDFGWSLVGRLDPDQFRPALDSAGRGLTLILVGGVLLIIIMTSAFVIAFVRPLERVVDAAERIAEGQDVYPPEPRAPREAQRISGVLARLQDGLSDRRN